jgi:hypothetical protein
MLSSSTKVSQGSLLGLENNLVITDATNIMHHHAKHVLQTRNIATTTACQHFKYLEYTCDTLATYARNVRASIHTMLTTLPPAFFEFAGLCHVHRYPKQMARTDITCVCASFATAVVRNCIDIKYKHSDTYLGRAQACASSKPRPHPLFVLGWFS